MAILPRLQATLLARHRWTVRRQHHMDGSCEGRAVQDRRERQIARPRSGERFVVVILLLVGLVGWLAGWLVGWLVGVMSFLCMGRPPGLRGGLIYIFPSSKGGVACKVSPSRIWGVHLMEIRHRAQNADFSAVPFFPIPPIPISSVFHPNCSCREREREKKKSGAWNLFDCR